MPGEIRKRNQTQAELGSACRVQASPLVLNTAVWQGDAPLPLDPWHFRSDVGAAARPPAEGRAESVPEAEGTGAGAVATPTTPPAGHDADSPAKFGGRTSGDWPFGRSAR